MIVGKAKIPSDLQCVLNHHTIGHKPSPLHKTIEHNRTSTSFVNTSLKDLANLEIQNAGKMSPLELNTTRADQKVLSGRQTINQKISGSNRTGSKQKAYLPKQRSLIVNQNTQSERNLNQEATETRRGMKKQTSQGVAKPPAYINIQSGEKLSQDYLIKNSLQANIARNAKQNTKTFTLGTMSDQSTTVMAPSQGRHRMNNMSANFAELGAGLINDTPRSKAMSIEQRFNSANKQVKAARDPRSSNLMMKPNAGSKKVLQPKRRLSVNLKKGSTRNLLNPGGLTHFNFI